MRRKPVFCANKAVPQGWIEVVRPERLAMFDANGNPQIRWRTRAVAQCDKQLFNWVGYWYGTGTVLVRYWVGYWYGYRVIGGVQFAHGFRIGLKEVLVDRQHESEVVAAATRFRNNYCKSPMRCLHILQYVYEG